MTWGIGAGVFNALLIIIPQYVCPYGYSNVSVCGLESYYYYYYRKQLDCGAHC